jgi:hypothetical protein
MSLCLIRVVRCEDETEVAYRLSESEVGFMMGLARTFRMAATLPGQPRMYVYHAAECDQCQGSGVEGPEVSGKSEPRECVLCGGKGYVRGREIQ